MSGLLKVLLAIVGIAVALLVAVVVAVALFVEPDDYRDTLSRAVETQTGRTLTLDGELSLSLFPCCGLAVGGATLSNPPGFGGEHFAKIDNARLGLRIWPLLTRREVLLGDVRLDGLDLALIRKSSGVNNWEFATGDDAVSPPAAGEDDSPALGDFSVAGVAVNGARVSLQDAVDDIDYTLEEASLRTGPVAPGQAFDLEATFRLRDGKDGSSADVSLTTEVSLDVPASRAGFRQLEAALQVAGPIVSGAAADIRLTAAQVDVDAAEAVRADVKEVTADLKLAGGELPVAETAAELRAAAVQYDGARDRATGSGLTAKVSARGGELEGGDASADIAARTFGYALGSSEASAGGLTARIEASAEAIPGGRLQADLQADDLRYGLDGGAGALAGLKGTAQAAGASVALSAAGKFAAGGAGLAGDFRLAELSPRNLLMELGQAVPETADPEALTRLAAAGRWSLGDERISVEGLDLQLDDTRITGQAGITGFDTPSVRFDLAADKLDLDRYLAPDADAPAGEGSGSAAATEIDTEQLRSLRLNGTARVGQLSVSGLRLADLVTTVSARDGLIRLDPMSAKLYDGSYRGRIVLDATGDIPLLDVDQSLEALRMEGLLGDLAEVDQLAGLMSAKLAAKGRGRTDEEMIRALAGTVSMNLADGVYRGMDIWHEIRKARALIRRDPAPQASGPAETRINALELSGQLADGVLRSERMIAEIPFLRLTGKGAVDLLQQGLDYRFQAKVFETPTFPDGDTLDDLTGLSIPLTITGPVASPKVGVDLAGLAANAAAQKAREKLIERLGLDEPQEAPAAEGEQQPAEKKEEKPRDLLKKGLRDLLQR
jgi:AsmA protein